MDRCIKLDRKKEKKRKKCQNIAKEKGMLYPRWEKKKERKKERKKENHGERSKKKIKKRKEKVID